MGPDGVGEGDLGGALFVDDALHLHGRCVWLLAAPSLLGFFSLCADVLDFFRFLLPGRPFGSGHAAGSLVVWIVSLFSSFGGNLSFGDWDFFLLPALQLADSSAPALPLLRPSL